MLIFDLIKRKLQNSKKIKCMQLALHTNAAGCILIDWQAFYYTQHSW